MHETQVSGKSPKLLWNTLSKLNKRKSHVKFCHKEENYLHTLMNASKMFLHWREITYGLCPCCLWIFQTEIVFWIFLEKNSQRFTYQKTKLRLNIRCSLKGSPIINLVLIHKKFTHCPRLRIELRKAAFEYQIILMEFCLHQQNEEKPSLYNMSFL